jgi:hypothetical protein
VNSSTATSFTPDHRTPGPDGSSARLPAGWHANGRPATLTDHLRRHGPPPLTTDMPGPLVDTVEAAGLTGRGGAGFRTARKLRGVVDGCGRAVVERSRA